MKKLIIAEKPSLAGNIILALKRKENFIKQEGYSEGETYIVSYAYGHLFQLIPIEKYYPEEKRPTGWNLDILPFFPGNGRADDYQFELLTKTEKGKTTTDEGVKKQFLILKNLMNRADVDEIIHCGDADREGEVIIRLILQKGLQSKKRITRLWLPEQTEISIRNGLMERKPDSEYDNLYREGLCRTLVDWMYGINLSRYVTLKTSEKTVYNVGRVLTPIVKAIYDREIQIKNFIPEKYLQLESLTENHGIMIKLSVKEKYASDQEQEAWELCRKLNSADARVVDVQRKKKQKQPGKLFSLSKLQSVLGKKYKMPLQDALNTVQALYEKGYVTYPRTNTEYLAENEKERVRDIIAAIQKNDPEKRLAFREGKSIFDDSKIESHSALTPTYKIPKDLSGMERQVYETIYHRFCAVFCMEPCEVEETTVTVQCLDYKFTLYGEVMKSVGWTKYEPQKLKDELPKMLQGELIEHEFKPVEKMTQPPKRYNSETLMNFLKNPFGNKKADEETDSDSDDTEEYRAIKKGLEIGTEATRTPIISKAISGGYISQKNDVYSLEEKGEAIIKYLDLLHINMSLQTSVQLQAFLNQVFREQKTIDEVLSAAREQIKEDFAFREQSLVSLYAGSCEGTERKIIGKCPKCGGQVYKAEKGYFCESRSCGFALWKSGNKYFDAIGYKLNDKAAMEFLRFGKSKALKLPSKKKPGETYSAIITADFSGKYPQWGMEFEPKNGSGKFKK